MHGTLPGLHIRAPWAQLILDGKKTIETRFYPLPKKYVGKEMVVIETPGKKGEFKARIVGLITFGQPFAYSNESHFYRDSNKHLVTRTSVDFTWSSGKGKPKWGWPVLKIRSYKSELPSSFRRGILFTQAIPLS